MAGQYSAYIRMHTQIVRTKLMCRYISGKFPREIHTPGLRTFQYIVSLSEIGVLFG